MTNLVYFPKHLIQGTYLYRLFSMDVRVEKNSPIKIRF